MSAGRTRSVDRVGGSAPPAPDPAARRVLDDGAPVPPPEPSPATPVSVTHQVLFEGTGGDRCDVCGAPVPEDDAEGYALSGRALYMWTRGTEVRFEEPPLCPSCAAAIGVSALARWEIEEEEG